MGECLKWMLQEVYDTEITQMAIKNLGSDSGEQHAMYLDVPFTLQR